MDTATENLIAGLLCALYVVVHAVLIVLVEFRD